MVRLGAAWSCFAILSGSCLEVISISCSARVAILILCALEVRSVTQACDYSCIATIYKTFCRPSFASLQEGFCFLCRLFMWACRCFYQVAERALFLWNNDHIVSLVAQNRQVVLPLIFSALERNTRSHWNQAVHGLTLNVRKMFLEMDQELFQECQRKFQEDEGKAKLLEEKREGTWKRLEAAGNQRSNVNSNKSFVFSDGTSGIPTGLNNNVGFSPQEQRTTVDEVQYTNADGLPSHQEQRTSIEEVQ